MTSIAVGAGSVRPDNGTPAIVVKDLVARYGDACNISTQSPEFVRQKLAVIREHCEREGRNYDDIEKTVITRIDVGANGENVGAETERLAGLAEAGAQTAIGMLVNAEQLRPFEFVARDLIPAVRDL